MASIIAGALALIVLETLVKSKTAQGNLSGFEKIVVGATRWIVSPSVPGIPDLARKKAGASAPSSAPGKQTGSTPGGQNVGPLPNTGLLPPSHRKVNVASSTSPSASSSASSSTA